MTRQSIFILLVLGLGLVLALPHQEVSASSLLSENPAEFDPNGTLTRINATMNNYTNTEYNFTLLIPADWEWVDPAYTEVGMHTTNFLSPESDTGSKATFRVGVYTTSPYLDTDTMALKNYTVEEYANREIQELEDMRYAPSSLDLGLYNVITKSNPQGDAWRIEFTANYERGQVSYDVMVFAKDPQSGLLYEIDANSPVLETPQMLPVINKIIESFRFL